MIRHDPETPVHVWDGTRMDIALEYRNRPRGPFGLELQRILDRMRMTPVKGGYVLIVREPFRRWQLARLSGIRGFPPSPVGAVSYASLAEAEWDIFKRRWKDLTGIAVTLAIDAG